MKKSILTAALALFILWGCSPSQKLVRVDIQRKAPLKTVSTKTLMAGTAKADITPNPGKPLAGYSVMAGTGDGFRTRLYARVVYIKPAKGQPVAIVQCDLLSGSRLVHHRVAELIAPHTDVAASHLMIAATHTHSGPGNFFGSPFYNEFASSAAGFDREYCEFLSRSIADAVIKAYRERRPARIAAGKVSLFNFTRNRSIEAYLANFKETKSKDKERGDIHKAVNPWMYLLRVDLKDRDGRYKPAAAISTFSIHSTVVSKHNDFYNADVFAYIERELEWGLKAGNKVPWEIVHAALNGTHGDNSPNYKKDGQGFSEARRLGTLIGAEALKLFNSLGKELKSDAPVKAAAMEVDLYRHNSAGPVKIADRPVVGAPVSAGAEDGSHPVFGWLPFFREGSPRWFFTGGPQGHKRTLGGPGQYLILPKEGFPHEIFFQALRVDGMVFIPLPFEVTWQAGERIKSGCPAGSSLQYAVISCSNGYFGYTTTPEEYSKQHYEGGHTLYGPNSTLFLAEQVKTLTAALGGRGSLPPLPDRWTFSLKARPFGPAPLEPAGSRKSLGAPCLSREKNPGEPCYVFRWQDVPPAVIDYHLPLVRIEASRDGKTWTPLIKDGRPADDTGYDVSVRFCDKITKDRMGVYEARWYNPSLQEGWAYRFTVLPRGKQGILYSETLK